MFILNWQAKVFTLFSRFAGVLQNVWGMAGRIFLTVPQLGNENIADNDILRLFSREKGRSAVDIKR
ncbi:hypothetical protein CPJ18_05605 [Agrobacterium rosae]|uniref:Uncharacterized protein n=1 Tax=Agrobacterium rosae TaxID=1972867 RepID=A0AAE5VR67_9HYPH|nr:hypothetical protein DXM21_10370 [Agrobacterium rosae]KAA3521162.1 hypothetical protein DXM25_07600 [Agrobacterium rosae]MQB48021.1 hypothetical protein [Agrobacterium rosae]POO53681.1 hypothetical protein CPJ18_05605 [Agrobacterium rosae]